MATVRKLETFPALPAAVRAMLQAMFCGPKRVNDKKTHRRCYEK